MSIELENKHNSFPKNPDFSDFSIDENANQFTITTAKQKITYHKKNVPLLERITLEFKQSGKTISSPIHYVDTQNLGGVIQRADRMDGRLEHKDYDSNSPTTAKQFPKGLLSARGFTILKTNQGKLVHNDTREKADTYFLFSYGDDYRTALKDFTFLNGKIPMLPKWALGNWFSRYQPFKDEDYKQFIRQFRKEKIPIDVIVPDMNWHKDGWFGTRFDEENFPDMKAFLEWTNQNGIHVGFNHHPGALIPEDPRSEIFAKKTGMDLTELIHQTDSLYQKTKWKDIKGTAFYGEGNSALVKPYFDTFLAPIMDMGLDFHWVDGTPSIENLQAYYQATENHNQKRAIVLTRQGYGSFDHHKYPIGFSADTYISWESLAYNLEISLSGANNGVYWSHDIGGHMLKNDDTSDTTELFARWIQAGALAPFNRLHATGGTEIDTRKEHIRRPWLWGNSLLNSARKFMQLKYKLMPYLYSLNREAHNSGLIMTRGMYIDYPAHTNAYTYAYSQYLLGPSMLIAPITNAAEANKGMNGLAAKTLWIPPGIWYDYFSGEILLGPQVTTVKKNCNEMPIYIKGWAIIPMQNYCDYTDQKPLDDMTIEFYQGALNTYTSFDLYEDDGNTLNYQNNDFRNTKIEYQCTAKNTTHITIHPTKGLYKDNVTYRSYKLLVKHLKHLPQKVFLNNQLLAANQWEIHKNTLTISVPKTPITETVSVHF